MTKVGGVRGEHKGEGATMPRHTTTARRRQEEEGGRNEEEKESASREPGVTESMRLFLFLHVCLSLLTVRCWGQRLDADVQVPAAPDQPNLLRFTNDDMVEVLQGFLDEAEGGGAGLSRDKKASFIPRCDVGERCAMKHGPRIGRLCDCLRGTACNTFFLRCY